MSTFAFLLIVVVIAVAGYLAIVYEKMSVEEKARNWCEQQGHILVRFEIYARPHRVHRFAPYTPGKVGVTFRRGYDNVEEERVADWLVDMFGTRLSFPPPIDSRAVLEGFGDDVDAHEQTPQSDEDRIRMEIAQRLDAITSEPDWARAHDLDGSGHVDGQEWEALRQKIEAEVRANFSRTVEPGPIAPAPEAKSLSQSTVSSSVSPPKASGDEDENESIW